MNTAPKGKSHAFSIILIMIALMVVGVACIPLLSVQYRPTPENRSLTVYCQYAASARAVETQVVSVVESVMNTVQGVCDITATSRQGGGDVTFAFKEGTDMETARFDAATRLRQIRDRLPDGAVCFLSGSVRGGGNSNATILVYTINADMPASEIVRYAREHLVTPLSRTEGVSEVGTSGAMPFEWVLTYNPAALRAVGLGPADLVQALDVYCSNSIVGTQVMGESLMLVRMKSGQLQGQLEQIPVQVVGGRLYRIGDFATIGYQEQPPYSYRRINGLNSIDLYVDADKGINTLTVADAVKRRMGELERQFPENFSIQLQFDASQNLENEIRKIFLRAVISLAILLLFVLAVSRSFRYLLVIGFTITANLLSAFIFYVLFGIDIELYSMAGITVSLGIIIDTAIVIADHYTYYGNRRVMTSIAGALLTTIAALLIVFFLPEQSRQNLTDFIWVIVINLTLSMVTAFMLVPALLEKMPINGKGVVKSGITRKRRIVRWSDMYSRLSGWGMRHRLIYVLLIAVLFAVPAILYSSKSAGAGYGMDNRDDGPAQVVLNVYAAMDEGGTVQQLNAVVAEMENWLLQFDEISTFRTSLNGTSGSIEIHFKDEFEFTRFPYQLKEQLWHKAINYGGARWEIPALDETDRYLSNSVQRTGWSNSIELYGYNYDLLYRYALELADSLRANRRVVDAGFASGYNSFVAGEFCLDYDREHIARTGIDVARYCSYLAEQLFDNQIGSVYSGTSMVPVRLRSAETDRFDLWHIRNDMVQIDSTVTRLDDVGSITKRRTGLDITRRNREYVISVGYEFMGAFDLRYGMVQQTVDRLNSSLPMGFRADSSSYYYDNTEQRRKYSLILAVILVIFMICAALFESLRIPLSITALIPVSFIGMITACLVLKIPFGQGVFAAMVMLCGITVNAGIYLASEYRIVCRRGGRTGLACYMKAYNRKIVPTILTILSTVLGLIPFLFDGRRDMFWFSFAVGVMSGMLFSVLATVFVMPVFFPLSDRVRFSANRVMGGPAPMTLS